MTDTKKELKLLYGIKPNEIYISQDMKNPIENKITFNMANPSQNSLVTFDNPMGLKFKHELPPIDKLDFEYNLSRFYIWFPWGENPEHLATEDESKNITCSPDQNNNTWLCERFSDVNLSIVPKTTLSNLKGVSKAAENDLMNDLLNNGYVDNKNGILIKKTPGVKNDLNLKLSSSLNEHANKINSLLQGSNIGTYWILFPKEKTVLNARQSVGFILDKIISTAEEGMTYMYIQTSNIEGYENQTNNQFIYKILPKLEIRCFYFDPGTIAKGGKAALYWKTTGANLCLINPGNEQVDFNGQKIISSETDQVYELRAENGNDSIGKEARLYIGKVNIEAFDASSNEAAKEGDSITLSWKTKYASSCRIDPDIGIVENTGSISITPKQPIIYILTCDGSYGPVKKSISIETMWMRINCFEVYVDKKYDDCHGSCLPFCINRAHIKWDISHVESCQIAQKGNTNVISTDKSGDMQISNSPATYQLVCQSEDGKKIIQEVSFAGCPDSEEAYWRI